MAVSTWNNVTSIKFHAIASSITYNRTFEKIKQHHCQPPTHSSSFKAPFQQDSAHCLQFCAMPANSEIIKICRISSHQTRTDTTGDYKYSLCGESVKLRGSFRGQLSDYFERSADHGLIVHSLLFASFAVKQPTLTFSNQSSKTVSVSLRPKWTDLIPVRWFSAPPVTTTAK